MIKRILALFCALLLVSVSFCACAQKGIAPESSQVTNSENQVTSNNEESSTPDYEWEINTSTNSLRDETSKNPQSSSQKPTSSEKPASSNRPTSSEKPSSNNSSMTSSISATVDPIYSTSILPHQNYGYKELEKNGTQAEIKAYLAIVKSMGEYEPQINFDFPLKVEELKRAYEHYREDYPQHFWRGNSYNYSTVGDNVVKLTINNLSFGADKEKLKYANSQLIKKVDKILDGVKHNWTDIEKIRYIHDYIVNNCVYDVSDSSLNSHNMYGALVDGKAVCEGYANAFLYLCRVAQIECLSVKGDFNGFNGTQAHMWTMVKLENEWYHIDVTADDPIVNGGSAQVLEHTYFNLSDAQIAFDHKINSNPYVIPKANGTKYNFFKYYGLEFSSLSTENFAKAYAFAAKNSYKYAELKFTKDSLLDASSQFIMNNGNTIVKKANDLLSKKVLVNSGYVTFMKNQNHKILSIAVEYK